MILSLEIKTQTEFQALWDALSQYVDNLEAHLEDFEAGDVPPEEVAKLEVAKKYLAKFDEKFESLAA